MMIEIDFNSDEAIYLQLRNQAVIRELEEQYYRDDRSDYDDEDNDYYPYDTSEEEYD